MKNVESTALGISRPETNYNVIGRPRFIQLVTARRMALARPGVTLAPRGSAARVAPTGTRVLHATIVTGPHVTTTAAATPPEPALDHQVDHQVASDEAAPPAGSATATKSHVANKSCFILDAAPSARKPSSIRINYYFTNYCDKQKCDKQKAHNSWDWIGS
jgi:hypothetical protein